ncbi:hypothetical protein CVT25_007316 [Psilocybe cyanescens]|uniref:Uncharacterized protein n=1 Tax=Psilocybe cyanescens TaxID=93625 RepID=A0A409XMT8_PSICY|nr:hypothetical protein CVT25_007316 [Psilocybe cyanescens]
MTSAGTDLIGLGMAHRFVKSWLIGNLGGAVAYGITITLAWNCLILLGRSTQNISSCMRSIMRILIIFMCLIETASFILATGGVINWSKTSADPMDLVNSFNLGTTFLSIRIESGCSGDLVLRWIYGTFMHSLSFGWIWRCIMPYEEIARPGRIVVIVFVTLLTLTSLGVGLCALVTRPPVVQWSRYRILTLFEIIALVVNGSISTLIIARILYHQRYLRKIFGADHGPAYTRVLSILIESASLTLFLSLTHVILAASYGPADAASSPENMVFVKLIPQTNTIAPILIIFRVAQGRTWQNDPTKSIAANEDFDARHMQSLKFAMNDSVSVFEAV